MTVVSLVAAVAPRGVLKEEKVCNKWHPTLCIYVKLIVRNRVAKVEFTQTKNAIFLKRAWVKKYFVFIKIKRGSKFIGTYISDIIAKS